MNQTVYTFHSPETPDETMAIITDVVTSMRGKYKVTSPGCVIAEWRIQPYHSLQFYTVMPPKYTFYIGADMVRVVRSKGTYPMIAMRYPVTNFHRFWNAFIESLYTRHPDMDFGLTSGKEADLDAIKLVGDGMEQIFTSTTRNSPSLGGALLGGALFGSTGAIIGGMYGKSYSSGTSSTQFSNKILAVARYSNGLTIEGELYKNSPAYHEIMANMSVLSK